MAAPTSLSVSKRAVTPSRERPRLVHDGEPAHRPAEAPAHVVAEKTIGATKPMPAARASTPNATTATEREGYPEPRAVASEHGAGA